MIALEGAKITNPIVRISDGAEALDYLFSMGKYADRDRGDLPVVVLLDLHLPRVNGIDILKAIRANGRTRQLPVVVLTSSTEEQDRLEAEGRHVISFIRKPVDFDQFVAAMRTLGLYWTLRDAPVSA